MATVPPASVRHTVRQWTYGQAPWLDAHASPRVRVIIDNDFAGDPDDLVQLAHHVLSPSVSIELIVASHLREGHSASPATADDGVRVALAVGQRLGVDLSDRVVAGANHSLTDRATARPSEAARRIAEVALADDPRPLFYAAGGGLTDLASALLLHPDIAERLTLVWIGGFGHSENPAGRAVGDEYNLSIDLAAAQVAFATPGLDIWQVPRTTYVQCTMSDAEMAMRLAHVGPLGAFLRDEVHLEMQRFTGPEREVAEVYVMGDSPLVLLTALTNFWDADASSCVYEVKPTPLINDSGFYEPQEHARPMRVYTRLDVRLMHEDLFCKIALFEDWQRGADPLVGVGR